MFQPLCSNITNTTTKNRLSILSIGRSYSIYYNNNNNSNYFNRFYSKNIMSKRKNEEPIDLDDTIDLEEEEQDNNNDDDHDCDSHKEESEDEKIVLNELPNKKSKVVVTETKKAGRQPPKQTVISSFFTKASDTTTETDGDYLKSRVKKNTTTTTTTTTPTVKKKSTKKSKEINILVDYDKDEKYVPEVQYNCSKQEKLDGIKIGAHMSIKGGIPGLVKNAIDKGFKAFAFFVAAPRTWRTPTIKPEDAKSFKEQCEKHNFSQKYMMPHGSYFLNLGSPESDKLEKSRNLFMAEMKCCEDLGITLYNFHPGSHLNMISEEESIKVIADSINHAHKHTKTVTAVIECTAGQGTNLGYKFEHLRDIIALVEDKSRVGVCLDTCHMFAAGYNIDSYVGCQKVFQEFDKIVGFQYLRGIHLNDSKAKCGEKLDRHQNIDKGYIGSPCFRYMVNDNRFLHIPMILETEGDHIDEVKQLYSYIKDDNSE